MIRINSKISKTAVGSSAPGIARQCHKMPSTVYHRGLRVRGSSGCENFGGLSVATEGPISLIRAL